MLLPPLIAVPTMSLCDIVTSRRTQSHYVSQLVVSSSLQTTAKPCLRHLWLGEELAAYAD